MDFVWVKSTVYLVLCARKMLGMVEILGEGAQQWRRENNDAKANRAQDKIRSDVKTGGRVRMSARAHRANLARNDIRSKTKVPRQLRVGR